MFRYHGWPSSRLTPSRPRPCRTTVWGMPSARVAVTHPQTGRSAEASRERSAAGPRQDICIYVPYWQPGAPVVGFTPEATSRRRPVVRPSPKIAAFYQRRPPRQSPLYRIIERFYPEFERTYDASYGRRYGPWRPIVGQLIHFHPHIHAITTDGAFASDGAFHCLPKMDPERLLAAWQSKVFALLLAAGKIDQATVDQVRS
jgi:hypothetical protein